MKPYMYNDDDLDRVLLIQTKIIYILDICKNGIISALEDLKGAIDTTNFIAHDYEGVNLPIIEFIIRERLPILKHKIHDVFIENK